MKIVDINGMQRDAKKVFADPDYPGFMRVEFRRHHEWYSIPEFVQKNPSLRDLTTNAPTTPDDVVGTVTSSGKDFLRDNTQNWDENIYMGLFAWISRGKGEGQKRTIIKNTHNKATVDKPWDTPPNKTSQYVISNNVQDVKSFGNTLPSEDMKALEKRSIELDKKHGRLNSHDLKKNIKYLDIDEI